MNQSTLLIASLAALFVLFLAAKGRLSTYGSVFFGPVDGGPGSTSSIVKAAQAAGQSVPDPGTAMAGAGASG